MKIALVHDYLIDYGGAERVLSAIHEIYPKAPIYVSIYRKNKLGNFAKEFENVKIIQSWFGFLPFADRLISPLRFLLPLIWKSFDLKKYDLIISSASWAVTKGFDKKRGAIEICYLHTPPRYLYGYDTSRNWKNKWFASLVNIYAVIVNHIMRQYDFNAAQKVDYFIANSKNVAARIKKFYRRDSVVIYPPVETEKFVSDQPLTANHQPYFLTGGRMVASKNFDLIIKAFNKLGLTLKIFGGGVEEDYLKSIAQKNIKFLGKVSDEKLIKLYQGAKAFILAQKDEDFGITAIEAAAAGCPVIVFEAGGYIETVVAGKTGIFFDELSINSLIKAIKKFKKTKFNPKIIISHAQKFSKERFKKEMLQFVGKVYARTMRKI